MICLRRLTVACLLAAAFSTGAWGQSAPDAGSNAVSLQNDPASPFVQKAVQSLNSNDLRSAAVDLAQGLKLNPHSVACHELLGSLYASKRLLPEAEQQFELAAADAPQDVSIKYYLADIRMAEGNYAAARTIYAAMEQIPGREDFTAYKVFLCDLMGGQKDHAEKELAAFKTDKPEPSYYFANAAWDVSQHDSAGAQKWLNTAASTFTLTVNEPYAQALRNIGYLPLPAN